MARDPSALAGIRVVDFTHVYQGPVGTQLLADYGADVIKVEKPGMGDWSRRWGPFAGGVSLPFAGLNRNKRSVAIDLKAPAGRQAVLDLIKTADVVVHNFRSGVMEKIGFGYEELSKLNPGLVYASSNGWGDQGPSADRGRGGHDLMARAEAGWFVQPDPSRPPIPAGISADYAAGLMLMQGILMALVARARTGLGQRVTTDLLSVAFHAHSWEGPAEMNHEAIDDRSGVNAHEALIDKSFATADGYIEVSPVFSENALRDVSVALGLEDLSLLPEFGQRPLPPESRVDLNQQLATRFAQKTTEDWLARLEAQGVLCARINTVRQAADEPQVRANQMVVEMEAPRGGKLRLFGTPLRLHGTPPVPPCFAPELGAHTSQVLAEIGYSQSQIDSVVAPAAKARPATP